MIRYMLDTNICIYIINTKPAIVIERFKQHQLGEICISVVTAAELAFGVSKSSSARNKNALDTFLATFEILPFDADCIWHYAKLRANLEQQGQPIGALDTMIAAHALAANVTLVTNNTREFVRIPDLHIENWAI